MNRLMALPPSSPCNKTGVDTETGYPNYDTETSYPSTRNEFDGGMLKRVLPY
jgi:hypothetical protein